MRKFFICMVFCLAAMPALAHSPLQSTVPDDGSELNKAPSALSLTFQRTIRLTRVVWKHSAGQSGTFDLTAHSGFLSKYVLPFENEGSGQYEIEWRGLGEDGHPQKGSFAFRVK